MSLPLLTSQTNKDGNKLPPPVMEEECNFQANRQWALVRLQEIQYLVCQELKNIEVSFSRWWCNGFFERNHWVCRMVRLSRERINSVHFNNKKRIVTRTVLQNCQHRLFWTQFTIVGNENLFLIYLVLVCHRILDLHVRSSHLHSFTMQLLQIVRSVIFCEIS